MTSITIQIPDEQVARLTQFANQQDKTVEEFIADIAVMIGQPEYTYADRATVDKAIAYVMAKNHELYKRLA